MERIIDGGGSKGQVRLKGGWKACDVVGAERAVKSQASGGEEKK